MYEIGQCTTMPETNRQYITLPDTTRQCTTVPEMSTAFSYFF